MTPTEDRFLLLGRCFQMVLQSETPIHQWPCKYFKAQFMFFWNSITYAWKPVKSHLLMKTN